MPNCGFPTTQGIGRKPLLRERRCCRFWQPACHLRQRRASSSPPQALATDSSLERSARWLTPAMLPQWPCHLPISESYRLRSQLAPMKMRTGKVMRVTVMRFLLDRRL